MLLKDSLKLYIIIDKGLIGKRSEIKIASEVIGGGATTIQLRDKHSSARQLTKIGRELRKLTKKYNVNFIINDRLDIALAVDADGIHLGQEDLPLKFARKLAPKKIIGISTHSFIEARKAEQEGADYIALGPIFKTFSKLTGPPVGVKIINRLKKSLNIPLVAIGGINTANIENVKSQKPDGIAIASAVLKNKNIKQATLKIAKLLN
ncbi:MAG: thiamine phosphate synthase [Candidatus Omnitrophota bacterium]|nr:thiamine phosphate synthase [Candidatus Omnitrophota bacterium]